MSEIEQLAKTISDFCEVERLADIPPHKQDIATKTIMDDAAWLRVAHEDVMCSKVPKTVGDVLSLMKVISYRLESDLEGENQTPVKYTVDNIIRGLLEIAGPEGSPLARHYGNPQPLWPDRAEAFKRREQPVRT